MKLLVCHNIYIQTYHFRKLNATFLKGLKNHECEKCGKTFSTLSNLKSHNDQVHEGKRKFACDKCEKTFTKKFNLNQHISTVHEGLKNFACHMCGKAFVHKQALTEHIDCVHETVKKYICNLCGKGYGAAKSLRKHIRNFHGRQKRLENLGRNIDTNKQIQEIIKTNLNAIQPTTTQLTTTHFESKWHLENRIKNH